jgi:hypothetical protein
MKIGVFDPIFGNLDLEPMLDRIVAKGSRGGRDRDRELSREPALRPRRALASLAALFKEV